MPKQPIKETIKEIHKLQVEGDFTILDDGTILIATEDGESQKLSTLMKKFSGKYAKFTMSEETEEEVEISEEEEIDED